MHIQKGAAVWILDGFRFNGPQRAKCTGNVCFTRAQDVGENGVWVDDGPDYGFRRFAGPERYDVWVEVEPMGPPVGVHLADEHRHRRFEPLWNLTRHAPKRRGMYGTSTPVTDPGDWRL